jgi:hypothetical protein
LSAPKSESSDFALEGLSVSQQRFLERVVGAIRERTGIKLSASDVVLTLIDMAMELDFGSVDFEEEWRRAQSLCVLLAARVTIEQEIRQTEADLHQALVHSPVNGDTVRNFRRNLRYQSDRLSSLLELLDQCRRSNGGGSNGAGHIVHAIFSRRIGAGQADPGSD